VKEQRKKDRMFTSDMSVEFSPLPKEMEEAYWAALHYFADVILSDIKNESESLCSVDETSN
jgi:hypothetical protein